MFFGLINWICSLGVQGQGDRREVITDKHANVWHAGGEARVYAVLVACCNLRELPVRPTFQIFISRKKTSCYPGFLWCCRLAIQSILQHSKEYLQFINEAAGDGKAGKDFSRDKKRHLKESQQVTALQNVHLKEELFWRRRQSQAPEKGEEKCIMGDICMFRRLFLWLCWPFSIDNDCNQHPFMLLQQPLFPSVLATH